MSAWLKLLILVSLALSFTAIGVTAHQSGAAEHEQLSERAHKLFEYDAKNQAALPAHRLRALSLAIQFHDNSGAEQLLRELEPQLVN